MGSYNSATSMEGTTIRVRKTFVLALLSIIYSFAFIVTPYWRLAQSPFLLILVLAILIACGIVWLAISGREILIEHNLKNWIGFGFLLAILAAIHYRYLTSPIAWRGDEHFHIENTLELVTKVQAAWFVEVLVAAGLVLFLSWFRPRWAMPVGVFLICFLIVFMLIKEPFIDIPQATLLRYPFLNYWLFSIFPKLSTFISNPYQESLYRIVPLIAMAGVVYFMDRELAIQEVYLRFLWMGVFVTVPIVSYYSSILYLEPLAVLLMLVVCLRIKILLEGDFNRIKQDIGWYALITVGFIKETVIVFLACFVFVRLIIAWRRRNPGSSFLGAVKDEIGIIIGALLPLVLYLLFRSSLPDARKFAFRPINLTDSSIYPIIVRSFLEQFGGTVFLFLGGLALLVWRKEYASAFFFLLLVIAYPLYHAIDSKSYVGYSRFNLLVLPPILAGSVSFIKGALSRWKIAVGLLGAVLVLINIWNSPLLADGTKKSHWGIYLSGITEEYYPYQETFAWIAQEHRKAKILFAGYNYPYPFEFYFSKYNLRPTYRTLMINDAVSETETLANAVTKAELRDMNLIVFHVLENELALPRQSGDFHQVKTFSNLTHSIIVYERDGGNR